MRHHYMETLSNFVNDEPTECHCGRPLYYGYDGNPTHTRDMCADCDVTRCDAYPCECPYRDERR